MYRFFLANLSLENYNTDGLIANLTFNPSFWPPPQNRTVGPCSSEQFLLLGSLCTYQPSINAFLVITILEFLLLQQKNEPPQIIVALRSKSLSATQNRLRSYRTSHSAGGIWRRACLPQIGELAIVKRNLFAFWSPSIGQLKGNLRLTLRSSDYAPRVSGVGLRYSVRNVKKRKLLWISIAFLAPAFMLPRQLRVFAVTSISDWGSPKLYRLRNSSGGLILF